MPAGGTIITTSSLDSTGYSLVPTFESGTSENGYAAPYWTAELVHLRFGRAPSQAVINIPVASANDETAPSVALVPGSPGRAIKMGDYCSVTYEGGVTLFAGSVVNIAHEFGDSVDSLKITALDHRYLLDGVRVIGQFHVSGTDAVVFRQGERTRFNPDGQPNCTLGATGAPVFCPINWGLRAGETPGHTPMPGKASYWSIASVLSYLQWTCADTSAVAYTGVFPWIVQVPTCITWSSGFAGSAVSEIGERKFPDLDLTGMKLTDALTQTLEAAGPYALYMRPIDGFNNELIVVRTRYNSSASDIQTANRAAGGRAIDTLSGTALTEGQFEEDARELFTIIAAAGETAYIERRVEYINSNGYTQTLIPAWSDSDFTGWKSIINTGLTGVAAAKSEAAFNAACARYPRVLCAYRISPEFDYLAGTPLSSYPRARIAHSPLPYLCKLYNQGAALSTEGDKVTDHLPVTVELSDEDPTEDPLVYKLADFNDGFRVDDDGTLWFPGLRTSSGGDGATWRGSFSAPNDIKANNIRMTLAIPCDHRLVSAIRLASDANKAAITVGDNAEDADRINSTHLSRLYYGDADGLYQYWQQQDSYPIPQCVNSSELSATQENALLRDDSTLLAAHANRKFNDYGRLRRTGRLIMRHIAPQYQPGSHIGRINNLGGTGNYGAYAVCQEVIFRSSDGSNSSEFVLG